MKVVADLVKEAWDEMKAETLRKFLGKNHTI